MPTYTFRCRKCGATFTEEHGFSLPHPTHHNAYLVLRASQLANQPELLDAFEGRGEYLACEDAYRVFCGGEIVRVYDSPNIIYRGSGFYHTDKVLYEPENPLDVDD
jgi:predicted nucleic acid-binding Zn ribbon protein